MSQGNNSNHGEPPEWAGDGAEKTVEDQGETVHAGKSAAEKRKEKRHECECNMDPENMPDWAIALYIRQQEILDKLDG